MRDQKNSTSNLMRNFVVWFSNVDTLNLEKNLELKQLIRNSETEPDIIALSEAKPKKYPLMESALALDCWIHIIWKQYESG